MTHVFFLIEGSISVKLMFHSTSPYDLNMKLEMIDVFFESSQAIDVDGKPYDVVPDSLVFGGRQL